MPIIVECYNHSLSYFSSPSPFKPNRPINSNPPRRSVSRQVKLNHESHPSSSSRDSNILIGFGRGQARPSGGKPPIGGGNRMSRVQCHVQRTLRWPAERHTELRRVRAALWVQQVLLQWRMRRPNERRWELRKVWVCVPREGHRKGSLQLCNVRLR